MKSYFTIMLLLCFCTFSCAQKLQLKKASPFTAVKWKADNPIVKLDKNWYKLERIDKLAVNEIIVFCKKKYGSKWKKRFSEDLVEVLKNRGVEPTVKVRLLLSNKLDTIRFLGRYTFENRQKVVLFNRKINDKSKKIKKISILQAIEDINQFQKTLEERSSYIHLSNFDYKKAILVLKTKIVNIKTDVDINFLTHKLAKIMAEIGDRHSYVKNENFDVNDAPNYKLQLPFLITPLHKKAVALKQNEGMNFYEYLYEKYPYVKSIDNLLIDKMIDSLVYKSKKAPKEAKFSLGTSETQKLGRLYYKNNLKIPKHIKVVLTNGKSDTLMFVKLESKNHNYYSKLQRKVKLEIKDIREGNFNNISAILNDNIGYMKFPQMFSLHRVQNLKEHLDSVFINLKNTKSLIIDLRYNSGGSRDLIQLIGKYIVPKSLSPWVANVAYLRTHHTKDSIYKSMSNRFLNFYEEFNPAEKQSIDKFNENFSLQKEFNRTFFSKPHYMILKSGKQYYSQPVYILVNEHSFSAATVFTSAFKELPNIKIVGITTDGSSGNSKKVYLKNSTIKIKFSTMLSFQRNGKTLDGNGTKPDIEIKRDNKQILYGEDYQLNTLIDIINSKNKI